MYHQARWPGGQPSTGWALRIRLKDKLIVVSAETADEQAEVAAWASAVDGHAFSLAIQDPQTFRLYDLGPLADACREPINVTSRAPDLSVRLISNLAHTPFAFDGASYGSVEAFWQGLKLPDGEARRAVANLYGQEARRAAVGAGATEVFTYAGRAIRAGTSDHWRLMYLACRAKFTRHAEARAALLATGDRPLTHKSRRDSRTIPGALMADIWMRIRASLANADEA